MAKIKVYELAKELNVSSKEVVEFLGEKNIEVKSHMSSLEEADAEIVRNSFGKSEKTEEKAAEAPKKKSIVQVFRPQMGMEVRLPRFRSPLMSLLSGLQVLETRGL